MYNKLYNNVIDGSCFASVRFVDWITAWSTSRTSCSAHRSRFTTIFFAIGFDIGLLLELSMMILMMMMMMLPTLFVYHLWCSKKKSILFLFLFLSFSVVGCFCYLFDIIFMLIMSLSCVYVKSLLINLQTGSFANQQPVARFFLLATLNNKTASWRRG